MPQDLLRLPEVMRRSGLGRTSIYERIKRKEFPEPIPLGSNSRIVAWPSSDIDAWIDAHVQRARTALSSS
jgi:prophage regulatory protein